VAQITRILTLVRQVLIFLPLLLLGTPSVRAEVATMPENAKCSEVVASYALSTRYHLVRGHLGDWKDVDDIVTAVAPKAGYLNSGALDEILALAFENAAGHGSLSGKQARVWWDYKISDQGVEVKVLNMRFASLPAKIRGRQFTSADGSIDVPKEQRDGKRGNYGQGVKNITAALGRLYADESRGSLSTVEWKEIDDHNLPLVEFRLWIPRPVNQP